MAPSRPQILVPLVRHFFHLFASLSLIDWHWRWRRRGLRPAVPKNQSRCKMQRKWDKVGGGISEICHVTFSNIFEMPRHVHYADVTQPSWGRIIEYRSRESPGARGAAGACAPAPAMAERPFRPGRDDIYGNIRTIVTFGLFCQFRLVDVILPFRHFAMILDTNFTTLKTHKTPNLLPIWPRPPHTNTRMTQRIDTSEIRKSAKFEFDSSQQTGLNQ